MLDVIPELGQMFLVGFEGLSVDRNHWIVESLEDDCLGGVILFDRNIDGTRQNIESPAQLVDLVGNLKQHAENPLFVAVDQEGGQVCRLKHSDGFPETVSAAGVSRTTNLEDAVELMDGIACTLAAHGINLNLAPVVDLAVNPDNPIISRYDRSFGKDIDKVVKYASLFIQAHHRRGIACCLKHFPGHGSSNQDSHLGFVDITECWQKQELEPYRKLIAAELADAVMTAHVLHRQLAPEGLPATLSRPVLNGLLRTQLGFGGLVVSDDLQMKAISDRWNLEQAVQMAVLAGVDLIIIGNNLIRERNVVARGIRAVEKLLAEGRTDKARIMESLERIRILKAKISGEIAWKGSRPTTR